MRVDRAGSGEALTVRVKLHVIGLKGAGACSVAGK